ncbi:MAG: chalcone isomerase family protein [Betaproteobacteria bacterium]|nr:chalcone isomerase family protein [Betaproteobacteria bacterium]
MRRKVCWLLALLCLATGAAAVEIEGVRIEERVLLGQGGPELVLNGAGVRHRMAIFKLYVGALYLSAKKTDPEEIIRDASAKRVAMHVVSDELTAKELTASLNNALAANHIPAELALIERRLQELNRMMNSVGVIKKGGVVLIDYLPARGTRITVNGEEKITIKGEDFFQALLRIWIGRKPVDGRLRDAMLGGGGGLRLF